jgi:hypothetical protein
LRQNYKKSVTLAKGGYNHLRCDVCDTLQRKIRGCEDEAARVLVQDEFMEHLQKQERYRFVYSRRAVKTTSNMFKDSYISMIVDAAGGCGTTYSPRFTTKEKNEPDRHTVLKTKTTFCVVHGVGTFLFSSLPKLGNQGANLTLEVIFRGIRETMRQKGKKSFKNIYIQLGNILMLCLCDVDTHV